MAIAPLRCELISWNRVCRMTRDLAMEIRHSGFQPEMIVAVARGGYVPARLLCDYLHIYELASVRVEHYLRGADKQKHARLKSPLSQDPAGLRVLVVDDVCDTGDTYQVVLEHLVRFTPREVKTAALQHKHDAHYRPHFVARHIRTWRWLIYPWAVTEDVGALIERLPEPPGSLGQVRTQLRERHGMNISEPRLREILLFSPARAAVVNCQF